MNGSVTLTASAPGSLSADIDLHAGAVLAVTVSGVAFDASHLYRLTIKPAGEWRSARAAFTVTHTAWTVGAEALTGEVNLNNARLIAYLGSGSRPVAVELWDDTGNFPVSRGTLQCAAPVQREDDVPDASQPVRTYTDDQIDTVVALASTVPTVTELPEAPVTGRIYVLTAPDDAVLAPPGLYVHDSAHWRCLAATAVYALGAMGAEPAWALLDGVDYTAAYSENLASLGGITLAAPGRCSITLDNTGGYTAPADPGISPIGHISGAFDELPTDGIVLRLENITGTVAGVC